MRRWTLGRSWRAALVAALSIAGILVTLGLERWSVERANRLHRAGALPAAAVLYGDHVDADTTVARLRYNLGTTLLELGSPVASDELAFGAGAESEEVRVRAFYNLGLARLLHALEAEAADTAWAYALRSVEASKEALRLAPGRVDARWNLALAQRMLDSIDAQDGRRGEESVDGAADADRLVVSDELRDIEDEDGVEDGPKEGEDETLAQSDELEPLSPLEADEILGSGHLDASTIIRKLLAFEGRELRMQRRATTGPRW